MPQKTSFLEHIRVSIYRAANLRATSLSPLLRGAKWLLFCSEWKGTRVRLLLLYARLLDVLPRASRARQQRACLTSYALIFVRVEAWLLLLLLLLLFAGVASVVRTDSLFALVSRRCGEPREFVPPSSHEAIRPTAKRI